MNNNKALDYFQAKIYKGSQTTGEPETDFSGSGQQWQDYRTIRLPGFDGSQTLNLDDFWFAVFTHQDDEVTLKLTGLETITRYSNSQQLKEPFIIVANLTYITVDE